MYFFMVRNSTGSVLARYSGGTWGSLLLMPSIFSVKLGEGYKDEGVIWNSCLKEWKANLLGKHTRVLGHNEWLVEIFVMNFKHDQSG
jgi:hypothetical protein